MEDDFSPTGSTERQSSRGDRLIRIGKSIEHYSEVEVPNVAVVSTLVGAAVVGGTVMLAEQGQSEKLFRLADSLSAIAMKGYSTADGYNIQALQQSLEGLHDASATSYGAVVDIINQSISVSDQANTIRNEGIKSAEHSMRWGLVAAYSMAILTGVNVIEIIKKEKNLFVKGGIPVSTWVGPKIGRLFVEVGKKINSKQKNT